MYAILKIGASIEASHPHLAARVTPSLALDLPLDMAKAEVEKYPPSAATARHETVGQKKTPAGVRAELLEFQPAMRGLLPRGAWVDSRLQFACSFADAGFAAPISAFPLVPGASGTQLKTSESPAVVFTSLCPFDWQ